RLPPARTREALSCVSKGAQLVPSLYLSTHHMRHETALIRRDRLSILPDADPTRVAVNHPAADHGIAAIKVGQGAHILINARAIAVNASCLLGNLAIEDHADVGAFPAENRLADIRDTQRLPARRQQIGTI